MLTARKAFETAWKAERPAVKPSMYLVVGAPPRPGFNLDDLATGGRDLMTFKEFEQLEPLIPSAGSASGPTEAGAAVPSVAVPGGGQVSGH